MFNERPQTKLRINIYLLSHYYYYIIIIIIIVIIIMIMIIIIIIIIEDDVNCENKTLNENVVVVVLIAISTIANKPGFI